MGSYMSYEAKTKEEKTEDTFPDPHSGYKPWVRFQYCKKSLERYYSRK